MLYRVVLGAATAGLVAVVAIVSWQVFSRYVTSTSAGWAPEAAQIAFVWAALLAVAVGVRQNKHLVVNAFSAVKNRRFSIVLNTFTTVVVMSVSGVLVYFGFDSLSVSFRRTFPALGVSTGWMYLALPVSFTCCALFALEGWVRQTFGADQAGEDALAGTFSTFDEAAAGRGQGRVG